MKTIFVLVLVSFSALANGPIMKGPFPQERTNTPKLSNATSGRYIYLGNVPKFEGHELEMTVSKMSLTNRVTAHVNQARIDGYAQQMFMRWKNLNDALMDPGVSLHPLVKITKLAEGKSKNVEAWAKLAEQYSRHILEESGREIYRDTRNQRNFESNENEDDYKRTISEAYFSFLFDTQESSDSIIDDNLKLSHLLSVENSRRLFYKHLGHLFTADSSQRSGHVGTLTFVYPIAATVEGPFDQPKEQITDLKTQESIEARWWSDRWKDEFGGFPFLLIDWNGVAFHGPISNQSPLDVWFLRRGYVSHGCHRMDSSDVLELRALMPRDLKKSAGQIKITILDYFDVVDWNNDGTLEAVDVNYYSLPTSIVVPKDKSVDETIAPFLQENQRMNFFKNHKYASKHFNILTGKLINVPKYEVSRKTVVKKGFHPEVSIYSFDHRPNRIIQYTEEGVKLQGFDDLGGKYPPRYFQRY